nr:uncharacterized protein LOC129478716 [Symphalangus syndactylus]
MGQGSRRTACRDTGTEGLDLKNGHLRCQWCSPGLAALKALGRGISSTTVKPGWAGNMQSPRWMPGKTLPSLALGLCLQNGADGGALSGVFHLQSPLRAHSVTAQVLSREAAAGVGTCTHTSPASCSLCGLSGWTSLCLLVGSAQRSQQGLVWLG